MVTLVYGMSNLNSWSENKKERSSKRPGNIDLEISQPQTVWKSKIWNTSHPPQPGGQLHMVVENKVVADRSVFKLSPVHLLSPLIICLILLKLSSLFVKRRLTGSLKRHMHRCQNHAWCIVNVQLIHQVSTGVSLPPGNLIMSGDLSSVHLGGLTGIQ